MYQRLHGLYWVIANLARQQPLLICVDDAQWADEASMAAERFLSLRIADLPMVLLLAARPAEVGQLAVPLAEILADPATISIRPGPLSTEGAGRRVETLLGSGDADFAAACHHATGGNPFLLEQLVREIRAEGIEPNADNAQRVASLGPDTVRASVLLRLERLPSAGGPVARALAVLGEHDVTLKDVATLAGVPEDAAADALVELERAGLVTGQPHLRFTHPILRAAIEDDMPAVERSRAHEQAALMLADREADAVAVAAHLLVTDPGQGDWARATLRRAARRAEALGDPSTSVRYLERAVAERPDPTSSARSCSSWAWRPLTPATRTRPSTWSARPRRAGLPAAGAALDRGAAPGRGAREQGGRRARGRARRRARGGRGGEAPPRNADRCRVGQRHGPAPARRHLLPPEGAPRNPADRLRALRADHGGVPGRRGGIGRRRATDLVHRALAVEEHGYYESVMRASVGRPMPSFILTLLERFDESREILDGLVRAARDYGDRSAAGVFLAERAWTRYRAGNAEGAEADASEALRIARETTRARGHAPIAASVAVLAGMERERPFEELEAIVAGLPPAGDPDTVVQDDLTLARAWLMLAQGDASGAADAALELDRADSWGCGSPTLLPWRSVASVALAQLGEEERALALAQEELQLARAARTPRAVAIAQRAVALAGPRRTARRD